MSPRHKSDDSGSDSESGSSEHKKYKDKKDKKDKGKDKDKDKDKKDKDKGKDKDKDKDKKDKDKKDKDKDKDHKDKDYKDKDKQNIDETHHGVGGYAPPSIPPGQSIHGFNQPHFSGDHQQQSLRSGPDFQSPPSAYAGGPPGPQQAPPPSGFRTPLTTTAPFPDLSQTGTPPVYDADGVSPVFIGSALLERSVHPCRIGPHLQPFVSVPCGGAEYAHHGRFDLLPFRPDQMEFVPTSYGRIPPGKRPIEGGYEENGAKLYHAVAIVSGVRVPGKTGEHIGGSRVAFGGTEHAIDDHYDILCWR